MISTKKGENICPVVRTVRTEMVNAKEDFVSVPGGNVWYSIHGVPSRLPPILAIHGGPGAPSYYMSSISTLSQRRQVIFYDQLGCGRSDRPDDDSLWNVDRFVEELRTVREALGLNDLFIVASSWGTMLLTAYIEKHGQNGIQGIVMSGPAVSTRLFLEGARSYIGSLPREMREAIWNAEARGSYDDPSYQHAMNHYYHQHVCRLDPWPECVERTFENMGASVYRKMWGPSEFTCDGVLKDFDNMHVLRRLEMPVLFTCGEFDEATPGSVMRYRDATPNSDMLVLKGASHMHHLESPSEYIHVVSQFIGTAGR